MTNTLKDDNVMTTPSLSKDKMLCSMDQTKFLVILRPISVVLYVLVECKNILSNYRQDLLNPLDQ